MDKPAVDHNDGICEKRVRNDQRTMIQLLLLATLVAGERGAEQNIGRLDRKRVKKRLFYVKGLKLLKQLTVDLDTFSNELDQVL